MRILILLVIYLLASLNTFAQTKETTDAYDKLAQHFRYDTYDYSITKNESWAKNVKTITFENQGDNNSTYIAINKDSTFIFLSIYESGEFLTVGSWTKKNDTTYYFNWNKEKSFEICKDRKAYEKYYKYNIPIPLQITNWIFVRHQLKLSPTVKRQAKALK